MWLFRVCKYATAGCCWQQISAAGCIHWLSWFSAWCACTSCKSSLPSSNEQLSTRLLPSARRFSLSINNISANSVSGQWALDWGAAKLQQSACIYKSWRRKSYWAVEGKVASAKISRHAWRWPHTASDNGSLCPAQFRVADWKTCRWGWDWCRRHSCRSRQ